MAQPNSEIKKLCVKAKKLQSTCETLQSTLAPMTKTSTDSRKILDKVGQKKASGNLSTYGIFGVVLEACGKECGCSELSTALDSVAEMEKSIGKEENLFFTSIKSNLIQTCDTYLNITYPTVHKEIKKMDELSDSLESLGKKSSKEKKDEKQKKLAGEKETLEEKLTEQQNRTSTLLKQACEVEKSLKNDLMKLASAQVQFYSACLKSSTETLAKLSEGNSKD
ncbi:hypothetical protein Aperf_G00000130417 [Anoplocephala perfoliata]